MTDEPQAPAPSRLLRIYVSRDAGLRALPGDYEELEEAQYIFEKHHGEIGWCVIAEVEPVTERPRFLAYGTVMGPSVDWKYIGIDDIDPALTEGLDQG
jgi:hypothetical protein